MALRIVRLGSARFIDEGVRLGTVRRPPRGVAKELFAAQNWYDVWLPNLAPSVETMKLGQSVESAAQWRSFCKKYRGEMLAPECVHIVQTLAALSQLANFSVGCYCEDEKRCHRSILRELFAESGALIRDDPA